jgi:HNH endonuclease
MATIKRTEFCARCGKKRGPQDITHISYCRECWNAYQRERWHGRLAAPESRTCEWCGESYQSKQRRPSNYCSRTCKDAAKNARIAAALEASKPTDRRCMHCGNQLPQRMRADAIFCSVRCNESAHALQRKLRGRTGEEGKPGYLRAFIAERDRWRCGICKKPVDRQRRHPDPLGASLDHVIPVSEGGTNDPWNLRLTHLRCNLGRRNQGGGEQLAML